MNEVRPRDSSELTKFIEPARLVLRGKVQSAEHPDQAWKAFVRISVPSLSSGDDTVTVRTSQDGTWEADILRLKCYRSLLQHTRQNKSFEIQLRVFDKTGHKGGEWQIPSSSAFSIVHDLEIRSYTDREARVISQQIEVANLPKDTDSRNLVLEVWESASFEGAPLDSTTLDRSDRLRVRVPLPSTVAYAVPVIYWLRLLDANTDRELGTCPLALVLDKGQEFRRIEIQKSATQARPLRNKAREVSSLLTVDTLRSLWRAGAHTIGDLDTKDLGQSPEIAGRLRDLANRFRMQFPERYDETSTQPIPVLFEVINNLSPPLVCDKPEHVWQYRFSTWSELLLDKRRTIQRYVQCADLPAWREVVSGFFLGIGGYRTQLLAKYHMNLTPEKYPALATIVPHPSSDDAFVTSVQDVMDDLEQLAIDIQEKCIDPLSSQTLSGVTITTHTGDGEHEGTNNRVSHSTYLATIHEETVYPFEVQAAFSALGSPTQHRNRGQVDIIDDWSAGHLLQYGDLVPMMRKQGRDGWQIEDWSIEVEHNGVFYVHLPGIKHSVWFDAPDDQSSDVAKRRIHPWKNPYHEAKEELLQLKRDVEALRETLGNTLFGQIDDHLDSVLDGNKEYLEGNWETAIQRYRDVLNSVLQRASGSNAYADSHTPGFQRLLYIFLLHIGDCYWHNHEFERAYRHFLTETSQYRSQEPGAFDDHFLWNHVAKCVLDWADYRYRKARNNITHFTDFGMTDDAAHIDLSHALSLENTEGPYKLYRRVLNGGFSCKSPSLSPSETLIRRFSVKLEDVVLASSTGTSELSDISQFLQLSLRIRPGPQGLVPLQRTRIWNWVGEVGDLVKGIALEDIECLALHAELSVNPVPSRMTVTLGKVTIEVSTVDGQVVPLYADSQLQKTLQIGRLPSAEISLVSNFSPKFLYDLTPSTSEQDCVTESRLILQQAQRGVDLIEANKNVFGFREGYIPYRTFRSLFDTASTELDEAERLIESYFEARERLEHQVNVSEETGHLETIASANEGNKQDDFGRATQALDDANAAIVSLESQIEALKQKQDSLLQDTLWSTAFTVAQKNSGLIVEAATDVASGKAPKELGVVASTVVDIFALSPVIAANPPLGLLLLVGGIGVEALPVLAENLGKAQRELNQKIASAEAEKNRAIRDAEDKLIDWRIRERELEIAQLERAYLTRKLERLTGINLENPAFWYEVMEKYSLQWASQLQKAIESAWLAERALYYEIQALPDGTEIAFDYGDRDLAALYTVVDTEFRPALDALVVCRGKWYEDNRGDFQYATFTFKNDFPAELLRIQSARGEGIVSHFAIPIRMLDFHIREYAKFQRIQHVKCYYDIGDANVSISDDDVELWNGHSPNAPKTDNETTTLSYWRVPRSAVEGHQSQIDDWIGLEDYVLQPKPVLAETQHIYRASSLEEVEQALDGLKDESDIDQITCFENSGAGTYWTLRLALNPDTWRLVKDIYINLAYWASEDGYVNDRIYHLRQQLALGDHTLVKRLKEAAAASFEDICHPENKYTDEVQGNGEGISFTIKDEELYPYDGLRKLKALSLMLLFDERYVDEDAVPKLVLRLRKRNSGATGDTPEIKLVSPSPSGESEDDSGGEIDANLLELDPVGEWILEMRSNDNYGENGEPNRFAGLADIAIVFDYLCLPEVRKNTLGETSENSPAIATMGETALLSWTGVGNDFLKFMISTDGSSFSSRDIWDDETSPYAPALAVFDGKFVVAWVESGSRKLCIRMSQDGQTWTEKVPLEERSTSAPALTRFGDHLYLAWRGVDENRISLCKSSDGRHWQPKVKLSEEAQSGPALTATASSLILCWSSPTNNKLCTMTSSDGITFGPKCELAEATVAMPSLTYCLGRPMLSWRALDNYINVDDSDTCWGRDVMRHEEVCGYGGPALVQYGTELLVAWTGTDKHLNVMLYPVPPL